MSDLLYIEARLQAIKEIASNIIEYNDAENVMSFCDEIRSSLNEESAKEPQDVPDTNAGDMISRKKLIEKLECIRWKMASDTTPMQALEVKFGNEMLEMVLQVINNQPPVQQIVRTPEEITYYKCCKDCGLNARCERENQRDCDEFLEMIDWLTGKQV